MLGISGVLEYMTDNLRSLLEKIDFEVANSIASEPAPVLKKTRK